MLRSMYKKYFSTPWVSQTGAVWKKILNKLHLFLSILPVLFLNGNRENVALKNKQRVSEERL